MAKVCRSASWLLVAFALFTNARTGHTGLSPAARPRPDGHFGLQGVGLPTFAKPLEATGAGIVRIWLEWSRIEPRDNVYDWSTTDEIVKSANQMNVEVLGYFYSMPTWAMNLEDPGCSKNAKGRRPDPCAIRDWADYTEFARDVAERYDGRHGHGSVRYIEIWNEVQGFAAMNPEQYGPWLINGYRAVKAGNPDAVVLLGAVHSPADYPAASGFIDAMLEEYARYYDVFNFHIYQRHDGALGDAVAYMTRRMRAYGVGKPMWITETATFFDTVICNNLGWYADAARGVVRRHAQALGNGVERVFWYGLFGLPTREEYAGGVRCGQPANFMMGSLGWVPPKEKKAPKAEFHPRPAYEAYRLMTSKLAGFSSVEKKTDTQYRFIVNGRPVHVLWCPKGTCSPPSGISGEVTITDFKGNARTLDARGLSVTENPIFVEERLSSPSQSGSGLGGSPRHGEAR